MKCEGQVLKPLWIEEQWAKQGHWSRLDLEEFGGHSALGPHPRSNEGCGMSECI